ncbi:MAG: SPOR domain-containing protein [Mariprofundus sp.]|nr:SPOR domain-containing protein [Mariprofundus sp.]
MIDCRKEKINFIWLLFLSITVATVLMVVPAFAALNNEGAYQLLKEEKSPVVLSLPTGEREILMAILAMKNNRSSEVIALLNSPKVGHDKMVSRLRAEAYRRKSVEAALRSGKYAHSVSDDISQLKNVVIDLTAADLRLQRFVERLNKSNSPQLSNTPVKVAAVQVQLKRHRSHHKGATLLASVKQAINRWRKDWQSLKADVYLAHYHGQFVTSKYNLALWSEYKRRVNGKKRFIHVAVSDIRLIGEPVQIAQGKAVLVEFSQRYTSSNYASDSRKRLFLVRQQDAQPWKILSEGDGSLTMAAVDSLLNKGR